MVLDIESPNLADFYPIPSLQNFFTFYEAWRRSQQIYGLQKWSPIDHCLEGIECFHYANIDGIKQTKSKVIAVDCLLEGLHVRSCFDHYPVDRRYVFFSGSTWNVNTVKLPVEYDLVYVPWLWLRHMHEYHDPKSVNFYIDKEYIVAGTKPLLFVGMLGRPNTIKDTICEKLQKIDKAPWLVKYAGIDLGATKYSVLDPLGVDRNCYDPLLDIDPSCAHNLSDSIPVALYNQARFFMLVETDIGPDLNFFPTEKTMKLLRTGMPFVVLANPGHLAGLRSHGFRTYNSLWNEDYDNIQDPSHRIEQVITLCQTLAEFDWQIHQTELELIAAHNARNLFNIDRAMHRSFVLTHNILNTHASRH